ncbi:glutaredoxin domain-containing protein [Microbulbifer sp. ZKSA006]|uniref:glutaredoxin domain-containing protein n=1 Tax=Microbulbifer sp. ZKSA006 TaxID=3243390 RepID=UPI004039EE4B
MKRATIYSTSSCPYCVAAKSLLTKNNFEITEFDVGRDPNRYAEMQKLTPKRTVPQITINEEYIGGYADLVSYFSSK